MDGKDIQCDFRNVPPSYAVCFLEGCSVKEQCLRRLVADHLPETKDFGPAVLPTMKIGEEGCRLYENGEPKLMAWGFSKLFYDVKARHETQLRNQMKKYLGGRSNYYRYHNGERLLTPEQQEWIVNLFQQYGYTEGITFEHYANVYDFDH